ncbi:2-phospho-L-lactate guanylyltransferase CofC [Methanocaldococcus vulcanius M7]|uniref:2-phospho-L-lactate guanylyltransferase n=1 Tax=Methanocaldococcus vulcanius (strain ATCC 700851 / DSM 12094 / M7) TaxID=579137 RepID=COFC_METVM|nr:2-phospho-L-lactate guanylyltransferase [Methanocaldococcus vulcanius]C9REF5.1 RecName: Full=2-phospho-L-lactate guanylyltransferase; Short=LP guanylyltransferase [Methanocaldococcus vulcanius M7]ACX71957.1 2-phospho-L-lactate guanylyltransferase CofC [Methanocaldococcus vulcanius M7]
MIVIIPVSPINSLKTRLSEFLSEEERKYLLLNMLKDIKSALINLDTVVVSRDEEILNFAKKELNAKTIKEREKGLNNAIKQAFEEINQEEILIIPADIPLIKKHHIEDIINLSNHYDMIIAPSRGGGTNLLYLKSKNLIDLKYEGFSFLKHLKEAENKNLKYYIYDSFLVSVDINTPEDLGEIFIHGEKTHTKEYLKSLGIYVEPKHSSAGRFVVKRRD